MTKVPFLFSIFVIVIAASETQDSRLVVMDSKSKKENPVYLVKFVEDSLDLTCELRNKTEEELPLKWTLLLNEENRTVDENGDLSFNETSNYVFQNTTMENGTLRLTVSHLQLADSGSYICSYANSTDVFNHTVTLFVRPKLVSCGKKFDCEDNQCISIIYKCDGVADCKNKSDESPELCGDNPCAGKIKCSKGRCIPKDWCKPCDPAKMNCSNRHRPDCCPPLPDPYIYYPKDGTYPPRFNSFGDQPNRYDINFIQTTSQPNGTYPQRFNEFGDQPNVHQHRYDINFIQTTIYSIIGCAFVFMIIVTILVIAICRVHMKRSPSTHIPNNRRVFATTAYHRAFTQEIGVYDLDISVNRPEGLGLLVTYNINNGVQIVGSPIDPPPYSEVASLPPREGPPPPYTLSQPCDGNQGMCNIRPIDRGSPPKTGNRFLRPGLSNGRVSSEPSLLSLNNRL